MKVLKRTILAWSIDQYLYENILCELSMDTSKFNNLHNTLESLIKGTQFNYKSISDNAINNLLGCKK